METILKLTGRLDRRAKSKPAVQGVPLPGLVAEAIADRSRTDPLSRRKSWMKHIGKLKSLRKENARINRIIERAFG